MRAKTTTAALLVLATATGAAGQECEAGRFNCFWFWNNCAPIADYILVPNNPTGLQRADVVNAVVSRLRAAGVYADDIGDSAGTLSLTIRFNSARGPADDDAHDDPAFARYSGLTPWTRFTVEMDFAKDLRDLHGNTMMARARSWEYSGNHNGRASEVMEAVRQRLDEFMNEFLRVNAPACAAWRQEGQR